MKALRALAVLTTDLLRRLLREGIVMRSLVFPVVLVVATILITVLVSTAMKPTALLAVTDGVVDDAWIAAAEDEGWTVTVTGDPAAAVEAGAASIGTDGATLWLGNDGYVPLRLEQLLREALEAAAWRPIQDAPRERTVVGNAQASRQLAVLLGGLYALYGVVFGAGSVARDRDAGTLEAELSLAVPAWVHGLARWLAGALLLAAGYVFSLLLVHAMLGVDAVGALLVHGIVGAGGAAALGLAVVGQAGLQRGFVGPLSAGLVGTVSLVSFGLANPEVGSWLPVASLAHHHAQVGRPVPMALAWVALAVLLFVRRTARS